jgi:hypothetical protein
MGHDAAVTKFSRPERRQHERFPQAMDVHARSLLSPQATIDPAEEFDGRVHNLSKGGACILTSCPLSPAVFVCCNFPVPDSPVPVPALMQVRWTTKQGRCPASYLSGFQFVT